MTLPRYTSPALANHDGLFQLVGIAGQLKTDRRTVHMWMKRRRTSHFPMPKAVLRYGTKWLDLYNLAEVVEWRTNYVPNRGGAPLGNRNWIPKSQRTTS